MPELFDREPIPPARLHKGAIIAVRLPLELLELIAKEVAEQEVTKSVVIRRALRLYFGAEARSPTPLRLPPRWAPTAYEQNIAAVRAGKPTDGTP